MQYRLALPHIYLGLLATTAAPHQLVGVVYFTGLTNVLLRGVDMGLTLADEAYLKKSMKSESPDKYEKLTAQFVFYEEYFEPLFLQKNRNRTILTSLFNQFVTFYLRSPTIVFPNCKNYVFAQASMYIHTDTATMLNINSFQFDFERESKQIPFINTDCVNKYWDLSRVLLDLTGQRKMLYNSEQAKYVPLRNENFIDLAFNDWSII